MRRFVFTYGLVGLLAGAVLPAFAAPYRVCTFSFHNPEETAVFRAALSPNDFEIVDLSPAAFGATTPVEQTNDVLPAVARTDGEPWPLNLCRADQRCDVLVIAGEFAGRFFGKNGHTLTLQEMDEADRKSVV